MREKLDITDVIGPFGRYQRKILLINVYRSLCLSTVMFNLNFVSRTPVFQCDHTSEENSTMNFGGNLFTNYSESYNTCDMPAVTDENLTSSGLIPCKTFQYSTYYRFSIAQEWNLICSRKWLIPFGYMLYSLGNFIAFIPSGIACDRLGRRMVACLGLIIIVSGTATTVLSKNLLTVYALRFFLGFGQVLTIMSTHLIQIESVGPTKRYTVNFVMTGWGIGIILISGVSWLLEDWRYFTLVQVPFHALCLFIILRYMPESLRWLLVRRSYKNAKRVLKKMLVENRIEVEDVDDTILKLKDKIEEDRKWHVKATFCVLLRTPNIRRIGLSFAAIGFFRSFINRGFEISISQFDGSFHANMCMLGLSYVILSFVGVIVVKFFKRRLSMICCFFLSAICFAVSAAIQGRDLHWLEITLAWFGTVFTGSVSAVYHLYIVEVFPTNTRALMIGSIKTIAILGEFLSPLGDLLGRIHGRYAVLIIFCICAFLAGLASFILPETKELNLPDTLEEAKQIANSTVKKHTENLEDQNYDSVEMSSISTKNNPLI